MSVSPALPANAPIPFDLNVLAEQMNVLSQQLNQITGLIVGTSPIPPAMQLNTPNYITFESWAKTWLNTYKRGVVKDNTFEGTYRNPVENHLIPYFGPRPLSAITPQEVQEYFKGLRSQYTLSTQRKIKSALEAIYTTAIENHMVFTSPITKSLKLTSSVPSRKKEVWTEDEHRQAFLFALDYPEGLAIITLMETAISRSELLGLQWRDFDKKEQVIRLKTGLVSQRSTTTDQYELVCDGLKNEYRFRTIPLSPFLCGLLSLKPRTITVNGQKVRPKHIFHAPHGGPYDPNNWYRRVLLPFMRDLHRAHPWVKNLTTHELRHTRATLLKNDGVDLFSISRLLGHVDLNMLSKRYAHNDLDALRRAIGVDDLAKKYPDVV